jgi:hypothetical protein
MNLLAGELRQGSDIDDIFPLGKQKRPEGKAYESALHSVPPESNSTLIRPDLLEGSFPSRPGFDDSLLLFLFEAAVRKPALRSSNVPLKNPLKRYLKFDV